MSTCIAVNFSTSYRIYHHYDVSVPDFAQRAIVLPQVRVGQTRQVCCCLYVL